MIGGPATQQNVSAWRRPAGVKGSVVSMVGFTPRREGSVFYGCITWLFFWWFMKTTDDCDNFEVSYVSVHFKGH